MNETKEQIFEDVSLDEFVLISIMKHIDDALHCMFEQDAEKALLNIEFAWDLLPSSIKAKIPAPRQRVFDVISTRYSEREIAKMDLEPDELSQYPWETEHQAIIRAYKELKLQEVMLELMPTMRSEMILGLEKAGLYIHGRNRIIPTADRTPEKPLPVLQKLSASLPRG